MTSEQKPEDSGVALSELESGSLTKRQLRIGLTAAGGYFTDGYDLLVLSGALLAIVPEFELDAAHLGVLTATAFVGMVVGSSLAGPLTDRFGRRPVFFADMVVFVVASALMIAVQEPWQLIALRFVIGVAIGADMPASAAMIAEFTPYHRRGTMTAFGGVAWMIGALVAIVVTLGIFAVAGLDAWRIALATGLVPAVILLILRHRTPETPRWLMLNGRRAEAEESWRHARGLDPSSKPAAATVHRQATLRRDAKILFRKPLAVVLFAMAFYWMCNNLYGSSILLYQATLINQVVTPDKYTALVFSAIATLISICLGIFVCLKVIDRYGRRPVALIGTATFAVALTTVGLFVGVPYLALVAYVVALCVNNCGSTLAYFAWAPELFPTSVRGRAVGIANACGKAGSVIGTLLLPFAFERLHGYAFLLLAGIALVNLAVTFKLAPESVGKPLQELEEAVGERVDRR